MLMKMPGHPLRVARVARYVRNAHANAMTATAVRGLRGRIARTAQSEVNSSRNKPLHPQTMPHKPWHQWLPSMSLRRRRLRHPLT